VMSQLSPSVRIEPASYTPVIALSMLPNNLGNLSGCVRYITALNRAAA
jgi:hypothetical protein